MPIVIPEITATPSSESQAARWFGVYPALVTDLRDASNQGRVGVRLPWAVDPVTNAAPELWARLATPVAGKNAGFWFIPDVGTEVLVAFESGDPRHPYVIGALWNGVDTPPESIPRTGANGVRTIRTPRGNRITFNDHAAATETVRISTSSGHRLTFTDRTGRIEIHDTNGNTITLDAEGVRIASSGTVKVTASSVRVAASVVQVDANVAKFAGMVDCDTLRANNVIASNYTPGAGNVW